MGGMLKRLHKIMIRCDSDDEECGTTIDIAGLDELDCGGAEECEVKVECQDDGCTCTINGEDAECSSIPGVPTE